MTTPCEHRDEHGTLQQLRVSDIMMARKLAASRSDAYRLFKQGAVHWDEQKLPRDCCVYCLLITGSPAHD